MQIYKELHIIIFFAATKAETGVVGRWFADFLRGSDSKILNRQDLRILQRFLEHFIYPPKNPNWLN